MDTDFSLNVFDGHLIKGDLIGAMDYLKRFPEQAELYDCYLAVFEQEQYLTYDVDADLNAFLTAYQKYYRDVFYLRLDKETAAERLRAGLAGQLGIEDAALDDMEENQVAKAFQSGAFPSWAARQAATMVPIFGRLQRPEPMRWSCRMGHSHTRSTCWTDLSPTAGSATSPSAKSAPAAGPMRTA